MAGRWVIDTNVLIAALRRQPAANEHWDDADEIILAAPVLGELMYGARHSARDRENLERLSYTRHWMRFVPLDEVVCGHYADIKAVLRRTGRMIPDNDIWIAAVCRATGAALASRDQHFDDVPDLVRDDWR